MKLKYLVIKDWLLITKNYFFYVTLFMAVLMVLLINFVIPEDSSIQTKTFFTSTYEMSEGMKDSFIQSGYIFVDSQKNMDEKLKDNLQSIGIIFKGSNHMEFRLQGYESEKFKNLLRVTAEMENPTINDESKVKITQLKKANEQKIIPFNQSILPLFHVMEPALLGLFLIASMIFSEKDENTITLYYTAPSKLNNFFLSKIIVLIVLGIISVTLTTVLTVGFTANYFYLIILTVVCSFMGSSIGLLLASFFKSFTNAMMWIVAISLLLSFSFMSYFSPSYTPLLIKFLPTYYMIFAYKEGLFPSGNPNIIYQTIFISGSLGIVTYLLALINYKRSFSRGF